MTHRMMKTAQKMKYESKTQLIFPFYTLFVKDCRKLLSDKVWLLIMHTNKRLNGHRNDHQ